VLEVPLYQAIVRRVARWTARETAFGWWFRCEWHIMQRGVARVVIAWLLLVCKAFWDGWWMDQVRRCVGNFITQESCPMFIERNECCLFEQCASI